MLNNCMRKAPAIFSVDLIQQEDGSFKVLEFNRGLDSGYEGYRMSTGGGDLWGDVLKPLVYDFADANKMHVKWYGKEHMLGRSKSLRKLKSPRKLRDALLVGDVITDEFCTLAEKTNSMLLDNYSVLWAAYFDKAFLAILADHVDGLKENMPRQRAYAHEEDWESIVEKIKEDFQGVEELIFKDASSCAGHNIYFIRMSDLVAGNKTMNVLYAHKRFTDTKMGYSITHSNNSRNPLSHMMFPHFVVQERVKAKAVPDLTRDWDAEIKSYEEKCADPDASLSDIGASPRIDMNKRYLPVIRAVVSAVPNHDAEDGYELKIHGTYYKYPYQHLGQGDDFDESFLLSDVSSFRKGPQAALLENDVQQALEKMIIEDLSPSISQIMDMSIVDVIKDLFESDNRADHFLGLNMLLDPQYFWGQEIVLDRELYDLTHKVLANDLDLQVRSAMYLMNIKDAVEPIKQMITGIVLKITPQLRSFTI